MQEEQDTKVKRALRDEEEGGWKGWWVERRESTREGSWARGYIMGNARGIPGDQRGSPVRMRRAD